MSGAVERRDASHTPDIDERLGSARRVPRDRVFENNHPLLPLVIAIVPLIRTASKRDGEGRKEGRKEERQAGRKEGWRDYLDMAFYAAEVHRVGAYML